MAWKWHGIGTESARNWHGTGRSDVAVLALGGVVVEVLDVARRVGADLDVHGELRPMVHSVLVLVLHLLCEGGGAKAKGVARAAAILRATALCARGQPRACAGAVSSTALHFVLLLPAAAVAAGGCGCSLAAAAVPLAGG